jgi:hypothetical protein
MKCAWTILGATNSAPLFSCIGFYVLQRIVGPTTFLSWCIEFSGVSFSRPHLRTNPGRIYTSISAVISLKFRSEFWPEPMFDGDCTVHLNLDQNLVWINVVSDYLAPAGLFRLLIYNRLMRPFCRGPVWSRKAPNGWFPSFKRSFHRVVVAVAALRTTKPHYQDDCFPTKRFFSNCTASHDGPSNGFSSRVRCFFAAALTTQFRLERKFVAFFFLSLPFFIIVLIVVFDYISNNRPLFIHHSRLYHHRRINDNGVCVPASFHILVLSCPGCCPCCSIRCSYALATTGCQIRSR